MIDHGLKVTINSDDPPMFGTNLAHEFILCAREMRLTAEQLKTCVLHSIQASWLDEATKQQWTATWSTEIDGLAAEIDPS